jgi:predicted amidophosphoribosyltransferase
MSKAKDLMNLLEREPTGHTPMCPSCKVDAERVDGKLVCPRCKKPVTAADFRNKLRGEYE